MKKELKTKVTRMSNAELETQLKAAQDKIGKLVDQVSMYSRKLERTEEEAEARVNALRKHISAMASELNFLKGYLSHIDDAMQPTTPQVNRMSPVQYQQVTDYGETMGTHGTTKPWWQI